MTRSTAGRRRRDVMPTLELLAERFPACFSVFEGRRKPLAIGIHLDILAALGDAVTADELGLVLRCYVANKVYRSHLIAGATRYGLNGQPAGIVTEKEAVRAVPSKKIPKAPPAPASSTPPSPASAAGEHAVAAPSPAPKRLSLADLRAAAAARKAATNT